MTHIAKKILFAAPIILALSGCLAPRAQITELGNGNITFTNRVLGETTPNDCAAGFSRLFPSEEAYIMAPGQTTAPLLFNFTDGSAITNVKVALVARTGRFVVPSGLPIVSGRDHGAPGDQVFLWRYEAPASAAVRNLVVRLETTAARGPSGGAQILITTKDKFDYERTERFSLRRHDVECVSDQ